MATIQQIEKGAVRYIDTVMAPEIPTNIPNGQLKKIAAISGVVYAIRKGLQRLNANPALSTIGAIDGNGNIDVEGMAEIFRQQIPNDGFKMAVPILGDLTFYTEDIDKILQYIKEA